MQQSHGLFAIAKLLVNVLYTTGIILNALNSYPLVICSACRRELKQIHPLILYACLCTPACAFAFGCQMPNVPIVLGFVPVVLAFCSLPPWFQLLFVLNSKDAKLLPLDAI